MLGNYEVGTAGDSYIKWQTVTQERFNADLLKAEQPEIHAKYLTKSSYRRFTIKAAAKSDITTSNHQAKSERKLA